jgi:hypothetical protein
LGTVLLLALGTPLPVNVRPWKFFRVDAVMTSAYYIIKNKALQKKIFQKGIKDVLDFDGMVILDSGVFQVLHSGVSLNFDELISVYKNVEDVDVKLSLDWPEDKIIENYRKMRKFEVSPVVSAETLEHLSFFENTGDKWIFVGRLAKILRHYGRNGFEILNEKLAYISLATKSNVWALGVGNWKTLPILMKNYVDGADTSSYRVAAAYGDIIIPGRGTCHVSGRKTRKKNWGLYIAMESDVQKYLTLLDLSFSDLKESFEARVLFNAYILITMKDHILQMKA